MKQAVHKEEPGGDEGDGGAQRFTPRLLRLRRAEDEVGQKQVEANGGRGDGAQSGGDGEGKKGAATYPGRRAAGKTSKRAREVEVGKGDEEADGE